ncbi:putative bifunctional diguanylate cyclase/phosphodiesterase [Neobacillus dielmonensis]|uniref:putative bifunctional diguanylate cyclase/phosphodiesterase n=1 Tax=Neobacillus dielmonensis TaxID=1347369 RepID=UPI0005A6D005|nr:EAL domain-containing protein [Neobacillus dielmonensis]
MKMEVELDKAQKRLRDIELALNESSIVAITDNKGMIQFANDKFCEISKYSKEELVGSNQNIVNSGYHSRKFFQDMWRTIGNGKVWKGEIRNRAKDGTYYWVDTTIVPFLNENRKPYQYIAIRHDITKRIEYEEKIKLMAYYDSLTLLPNRNLLQKWITEHVIQCHNQLTVLFLDIDNFKSINDNFGHQIGDLVLKETARRLKLCLRRSDFISRQGGDEFIIILNGLYDKEDIIKVVVKIQEQVSLPFYVNDKIIITTTSIGISKERLKGTKDDICHLLETLIQQADTAMYHAKKLGGNTYEFITPNQNTQMKRYYLLEEEIKHGLTENQFYILYQPLIDLRSHRMVGAEALLRWNNPQVGPVSPSEFIPLLEEKGLIIPIGNWVLKTVCKQLKRWQENGVYLQRVSVNVSPIQFTADDFLNDIKQILNETQIEPQLLEFEITEGTLLNVEVSSKILTELKRLGIKVAIDDFGTGYSSLNYLKRLSIDTLKIDKSFIDDIDIDDEIIVNTIISMGKHLKLNVLAEGIENEKQLNYLLQQYCDEGQGYYWSMPVTADAIQRLYELGG